MRISHPEPLDERVMLSVGREGIEPLVAHLACFMTTALQTAARSTTQLVARVGVEPTDNHEGLSFVAFPFAYRAKLLSTPDRI